MFSSKQPSLGTLEKGMWVDFVENNERAKRIGYGRLSDDDVDDWYGVPKKSWSYILKKALSDALILFAVSPYDIPGRIARSLMPPVVHRFRLIHVDLLGPSIALALLNCLIIFFQTKKGNPMVAEALIFSYFLALPLVIHSVLRCFQAAITFMQLLTLIGYSLYGPLLTLSVSLMIDNERSNAVFFISLAVFSGLSTLRVVLVLLAALRIPAARLLVCSSVALVQLLFVVWLHFTYLHPTFVFGRGGNANVEG